MNRLFRSNSLASSSSRSSLAFPPDIINEEEHVYEEVNLDLNDWNIPKVPTKEIYKTSFLKSSFSTNYNVKTVEHVYALNKEHDRIQLLTSEAITKQRKNGFNFLHIGLIQVAVKPLTSKGINASILLCLRDARHTNYNTSILGMMESSLFNGPIHFNCFPDFTLSLTDPHILKTMTLNIKTSGYEMLEGSKPLALIYRIYYKCLRTNLNVHALVKSPKDKTLLIQSSTNDANIQVPRSINWKDINLPNDWLLENENHPRKVQNNAINLERIQEYLDGSVRISFDQPRFRNLHIRDDSKSRDDNKSQTSYSTRKDDDLIPRRNLKLKEIDTTSQVSKPCYTATSNFNDDEDQHSPTQTDFETGSVNHQLLTINKDYKTDMIKLGEDFESKENRTKRRAYREKYSPREKDKIIRKWKTLMNEIRTDIKFFDYLDNYYKKINVLTKIKSIK